MAMTIFIAGGGTGGHIYPALAIARSLKKAEANLDIHFVGSTQGLESKIIPETGFQLHLIPIGRLNNNVNMLERLRTLFSLPLSFVLSLWLLLRYRPKLVLGVGGFASAPVLFVGALLGFRTVIWEPNAYPGLANRWLGRMAGLALVVFAEAKALLKVRRFQEVGLPVREEIESLGLQKSNSAMEVAERPFRVLVFGGSQGARGINNTVCDTLVSGGEWLRNFDIIHQTGKADFLSIQSRYQEAQTVVDVREYLAKIYEQYAWADLVICRSGVSSISELAAAGKSAILIPFPFAADNHQQKNAEALVKENAAIMVIQKDFTPERLKELLEQLRQNTEQRLSLSENIRQFHRARAADSTARILLDEISGR